MAVVYLQTVEVIVASEGFVVHHSTKIQVGPPISIGGNVTGVIRQQETDSGTEIGVAVLRATGSNVRWLLYHPCGRFSDLVIIEVDLRTGKEVTFPQTEQEPRIHLDTAITVFAGVFTARIVLVGAVSDAVEVFQCVLISKDAENTETVAFKEKLWLGEQVQTSFEHQGDSHRNNRTLLGSDTRVHTESHQGATADQKSEIRSIAGTT